MDTEFEKDTATNLRRYYDVYQRWDWGTKDEFVDLVDSFPQLWQAEDWIFRQLEEDDPNLYTEWSIRELDDQLRMGKDGCLNYYYVEAWR